ncbi:RmlC-like cupin domain-containing protein [Schizophyllum commune]
MLDAVYKALIVGLSLLVLLLAYQTPLVSNKSFSTSLLRNMAAAQKSRSVVKKVYAVETPEGEGALVRRSIGSMSLRNLSPFLMLDHFHISKGGFPDHPHRGQATVTYMLQGTSNHEDSAGHAGTLRQGGVQWMTAGRGIMHAEMPVLKKGEPEPDGLQLWIDLPKQYKMMEPNYQELDPESIPTAYPEGKDGPTQIKVISGKSYGVESPVKPYGGCWYFHVIMSQKGSSIFQEIPAGWTAFIYLFKGAVTVGDETTPNEKYHTLVLDSGKDGETGVSITSAEDGTEFVIVAGEPLDQPVVQYGPFVMTSREEIQKTFLDYQMGINGFEGAREWKSKIGGR